MKIIVDIGHARKTGAEGNGLEEHEVSCVVAGYLVEELGKLGHEVLVLDFPGMSNAADLNETIKAANASGYEAGVSLHCDSASTEKTVETDEGEELIYVPNPAPHGAHVCFYPGSVKGARLASAIASELCVLLPGRANKVQGRANLAILRKTKMPFVLCECGFISNPEDAEVMRRRPKEIAEAIAKGVDAYARGK